MKLNIDKLIILVAIFSLVIWPVSGKSQTGTFGDITGDGKVDLQDSIVALQVSVQISPSTPVNLSGDVNGDYRIGLEEAIYAIQKVGGFHNHPPELSPIGNKTADVDSELSFSISASDPDGDGLSYKIIDLPSGATFNTNTLTFSWTPNDSQNGTYNLTFTVGDIYGALDSETITIIVNNQLPDAPCCPHPTNGEGSVSIHTFLSWGHSATIMKSWTYNIYLGTSIDPPLVKNGHETLFYFPNSLNDNTTYYWKINSIDDQGLITEGPLWHFHALAEPSNSRPDVPSNPWPEDGAVNIAPPVALSWTGSDPDGDDIKYHLYWGLTEALSNQARDIDATTYTLMNLTCWYRHYWKIIAEDEHGAAREGPLWSFDAAICTDNRPPDEPSNPSPSDGTTCVNPVEVNLRWAGSDPDGDEITYDLYWGTTPLMMNWAFNLDDTFYQLTDLQEETLYYWQVIAEDRDFKTEGPVWTFFTNSPPDKPSNPSPSDGDMCVNPDEVNLTWVCSDPDGDEISYELYWDTTPSLGNGPFTLDTNFYQLKDLEENTLYYWKVIARDEYDCKTEGTVWTFQTETGGEVPIVNTIITYYSGEGIDDIYDSARSKSWNEYVNDNGTDTSGEGAFAIGQLASAGAWVLEDPLHWGWKAWNRGWHTRGEYTLHSKAGYSKANLVLHLLYGFWPTEPNWIYDTFIIEFYIDGVKVGEHPYQTVPNVLVDEEITISLPFDSLKIGSQIPVEFRSNRVKRDNPIPIFGPNIDIGELHYCFEFANGIAPHIVLE